MNTTDGNGHALWCDKHRKWLYEDRNATPLFAYALSVRTAVEHRQFPKLVKRPGPKNYEAVEKAFSKIKPVCCFLGDGTVTEIIESARKCPDNIKMLNNILQ